MAFGLVACGGKQFLAFLKVAGKIGTTEYYSLLRYHVYPWLKANNSKNKYAFIQDSALAQKAAKVQK